MGDLFKRIFSSGVKDVVQSVGEVIDDLVTSKEEKQAMLLSVEREVNRHLEQMESDAIRQAELEFKDRESARAMQAVALQQSDVFSKRFLYYLASFILLAATGFGFSLCFLEIPEKNQRLVEMFLDVYLFGGAITVIGFFFGSSKATYDRHQDLEQREGKVKQVTE